MLVFVAASCPRSVCWQNCDVRAANPWVLLQPCAWAVVSRAALLCSALPGWAVPCSCWLTAVLRPRCDNWHYIEWHWTKIPKGDQERWSGEQLVAWVVSLGLGWQPSSQGTLSDEGGTCHPLGLPAESSLSPWGTAPAVFCVGTPANALLQTLGSVFELLVLWGGQSRW